MGFSKDDRSFCSKTSDAPMGYEIDGLSAQSSSAGNLSLLPTMEKSEVAPEGNGSDVDITTHTSNVLVEQKHKRKGFVNALIDSAVPRDVMENTVGIARGDFTVEKKTLLYHAAASDEYSLFAKRRKAMMTKQQALPK
jgi:hypothetical protein